jgi:hypothetical protein
MRVSLACLCLLAASSALAQAPVYRCEAGGKVSYSDAPCVGARTVDVTPTQGMDKMGGQSRKGAEVQHDEGRKVLDKALQPLTGKSHEDMDVLRRRVNLSPGTRARCGALDGQLAELQGAVAQTSGAEKGRAEVELYKARKSFFDLQC